MSRIQDVIHEDLIPLVERLTWNASSEVKSARDKLISSIPDRGDKFAVLTDLMKLAMESIPTPQESAFWTSIPDFSERPEGAGFSTSLSDEAKFEILNTQVSVLKNYAHAQNKDYKILVLGR